MYNKEYFPKKSIYIKPKIEFDRFASRPNFWKEGLVFYKSETDKFKYNLVNIKDLEEI